MSQEWRWERSSSLRRMPQHWSLSSPEDNWGKIRALVWLGVKTIAFAAVIIVIYAVAGGA